MTAPLATATATEQRDLFQKLREAFEANRSKGKTLFECALALGLDAPDAERFVNALVTTGQVFYVPTPNGLEARFME